MRRILLILPVVFLLACAGKPPPVAPVAARCVEAVTESVLTMVCDYIESNTSIRCSDLLQLLPQKESHERR